MRSYSPQVTVAGGQILDAHAAKHHRRNVPQTRKFLSDLIDAEAQDDKTKLVKFYLETAAEHGASLADLRARTGWHDANLIKAMAENVRKKRHCRSRKSLHCPNAF